MGRSCHTCASGNRYSSFGKLEYIDHFADQSRWESFDKESFMISQWGQDPQGGGEIFLGRIGRIFAYMCHGCFLDRSDSLIHSLDDQRRKKIDWVAYPRTMESRREGPYFSDMLLTEDFPCDILVYISTRRNTYGSLGSADFYFLPMSVFENHFSDCIHDSDTLFEQLKDDPEEHFVKKWEGIAKAWNDTFGRIKT